LMADASTSDVASVAAGEEEELQAALALSLTSVDAPSLVERVRDDAEDAVKKLELLERILSKARADPVAYGTINLSSEKAGRLLDVHARAVLQHAGFEDRAMASLTLAPSHDPSALMAMAVIVADALPGARAAAAANPLADESLVARSDDDDMRAALALSLGEEPRSIKRPRHVAAASSRPPNALRKGQDFMFRTWSAYDVLLLGPQTHLKLQAIMDTLVAPGFPWLDATFEEQGLDDNYLETGWDYEPGERTPPPPELSCVAELVSALLDQLTLFHGGDLVVPTRCFVNLYRDGGNSVPSHVHHCRQLTMSLGAMRVFTARGPGGFPSALRRHVDAGGALRLPMRSGDVVVCDGQAHGVEKVATDDPRSIGARASINLFYHTAHDSATQRSGRGPIEITSPAGDDPSRPRWSICCYRCGYDGHMWDECPAGAIALPEDWND